MRKLMTMHKAFTLEKNQPKSKKAGREHDCMEDSKNAAIQVLKNTQRIQNGT